MLLVIFLRKKIRGVKEKSGVKIYEWVRKWFLILIKLKFVLWEVD